MMFQKKRILVIDDDEAVLDYLRRKIGFLYDLKTTSEPRLAHEIAMREAPDLVLCDIDMPCVNGGEVSAKFFESIQTRHIPFVYFTSLVSPSWVRGMHGCIGARHGLSKATPIVEMIEIIERLLQ